MQHTARLGSDEASSGGKLRRDLILGGILLAFLCVNMVFLLHHENWRDEAQAWLLARDLSVPELIEQMSYEGHPCLWHLLLMPLAKLGLPYASMNVLSLVIVAAAAALLLWKSPFPLPLKAMALFVCPLVYFYPVISRSYCLIALFGFMMATFYQDRRERPLRYGLSIALMVQTHLIMLGMAAMASLVWLVEAICGYRRDRDRAVLLRQGAGLSLPLLSAVLFALQVRGAQASSAFTPDLSALWRLPSNIISTCLSIFRTMPRAIGMPLAIISFAFVAFVVIYALWRREFALFKPALIAAGAFVFQQAVHLVLRGSTAMRRLSLVIVALWAFWVAWPIVRDRLLRRLLALAMALVCVASYLPLRATPMQDLRMPYSNAKSCAEFIEATLPADALILEVGEAYCSAVLPYLPADRAFYSPYTGEEISYVTWNDAIYDQLAIGEYDQLCQWATSMDADCDTVYLLVAKTSSDMFSAPMIEGFEPYLTQDALIYKSTERSVLPSEYFELYAIPVA